MYKVKVLLTGSGSVFTIYSAYHSDITPIQPSLVSVASKMAEIFLLGALNFCLESMCKQNLHMHRGSALFTRVLSVNCFTFL